MSRKKGGDYTVGYGRPPVGKRFKKGDRANPKGRPKKVAETVHERVSRLLQRQIEVTEGGIAKAMSVEDAMLLAVGQKALKGDLKAIAFLMNLRGAYEDDKATAIDPARLAAFDQETLRRYVRDVEAREARGPDSNVPDEPSEGGAP